MLVQEKMGEREGGGGGGGGGGRGRERGGGGREGRKESKERRVRGKEEELWCVHVLGPEGCSQPRQLWFSIYSCI